MVKKIVITGTQILIKNKKNIKKTDYLLVLAWNFYNEIKKKIRT